MNYILDDLGYIEEISFGGEIVCSNKSCTEYNGNIPSGYETLLEWSLNANIRAYKIVNGDLVYDENKDKELQAIYKLEADNYTNATRKYVNDKLNQSTTIFDDNLSVQTNELYITNSNESEIPEIIIEGKGDLKTNTDGYIEDSRALPVDKFIVEGKSEQETSVASANKLDLSRVKSGFINMSTGAIETNADYPNACYSDKIYLKQGEILYVLSNTTELRLRVFKPDDSYYGSIQANTYTAPLNCYVRVLWLNTISGTPMVKINDNSTTYVEFAPDSPSPNYPSEIETVKGIENLFPIKNLPITQNGITISQDEKGNIILNGTPTITSGNIDFHFYDSSNKITLTSGTYTTSVANKKVGISVIFNNTSTIAGALNLIKDTTSTSITRTVSGSTINDIRISIRYDVGTLNNFILNPQVVEGNLKPYVPYGRYLYNKINGKNLFDKDNAPVIKGYTNSSTGKIVASNDIRTSYIKCKPNTTYTAQKISGYLFNLSYSDTQPTIGTSFRGRKSAGTGIKNTITTDDSAKYLIIEYYNKDGNLQAILDSIQIEEGNATEYEPYKENIITYDLKKENLFDKDTITLDYRLGSDGSPYADKNYFLSDYIPVDSLSKYVYKRIGKNVNEGICYYDENKNFILRISDMVTSTAYTFETTETTKYIRIADSIDSLDIAKVYEGTGSEDYHELASIGDIKDELDEVSGVLTKRIGKVVLNGSESWTWWGNAGYTGDDLDTNAIYLPKSFFGSALPDYTTTQIGSMLYVKGSSSHFVEIRDTVWLGNSNRIALNATTSNSLQIRLKNELTGANSSNTNAENLATFKTWLSNNPVTVYYVLATPETIQLDPIEIELYDGINNINVESNIEPSINITYTSQKTSFTGNLRLFITNDNILPIETVNHEINGLNVVIEEDRTITLNGTTTEETEIVLNGAIDNIVPIFMLSKNNNFIASGLNEKITLNLYNYNGTDRELVYSGTGGEIRLNENKSITCSTLTIASGTNLNLTIKPMIATKETDYVQNKKNETLEISITELNQNEYLKIDRSYVYLCGEYDEELKMINALKSFKPNTLIQLNHDRLDLTTKYFTEDYLNERISKIEVEQESINLEVGKKLNSEEFTGANILLEVNKDESNATINADKINLNGVVTANNTFKINTDGSMEATGGKIGGWIINSDRIYSQPSEGNLVFFANGDNEYKDVLVCVVNDTVPFYLHSDGYLYATNGYIAGNMVSSGINAGNITAGTLNIHNGSTYYLKMGFGTSHPEVSGLNVTGSGGIDMNNHSIGACYNIGTQYISASGDDGIVKCNTIFQAETLKYKDDSGVYRDVVGLYRWFLNGKSDYIDVRDADGSTKLRLHFSNGLYTGYTKL